MTSTDDPPRPDGQSALARLQVWQAIERRWCRVLDLYERALLQRICDLSAGWGRPTFEGSLSQIVEGRDGDGGWSVGPIGFKQRTAEKALASLRAKGLLTTENITKGKSILGMRFAPAFELIMTPWEGDMAPTIRAPKRLKNNDEPATPRTTCGTPPHIMRHPPAPDAAPPRTTCGVYNRNTQSNTQRTPKEEVSPSAPPLGGLFQDQEPEEVITPPVEKRAVEVVETVLTKNKDRQATKLELAVARIADARPWVRGKKSKAAIRPADIELVWSTAFRETFNYAGAPVAWSTVDNGQAMTLFGRWTVKQDGSKPNGEFSDFIVWVVTNWKDVMAKDFGWMKESPPPEHPSIRFLAKFAEKFENAWLTRKRKTMLNNLDLDEIAELRLKGYSDAAALEMVAQRKMGRIKRESREAPRPAQTQARVRPRTPPVQPVATEKRLPAVEKQPTSVVRQSMEERGWAKASALFDAPPEERE